MIIVRDRDELARALAPVRAAGRRIGFVPTMGALHEGHLSLVRLARERSDFVAASIFVNPTQFGPREDLASYPRTPEADAAALEAAGCELLFLPEVTAIYPPGSSTRVRVDGPSRGFEGERRPGHFEGVATVVSILFGLVRPDVAVFGEKDAQQLAVIRALVQDLALPVEIVGGPTVREPDGLAMSSRNAYLSPEERRRALVLSRALEGARRAIAAGERGAATIVDGLRAAIAAEPGVELEYAAAVDPASFTPVATLAGEVVFPVAARVGTTRLLDNLRLRVPERPKEERTVVPAGATSEGASPCAAR